MHHAHRRARRGSRLARPALAAPEIVAFRNVAAVRRRGFGGSAFLAASVALLAVAPAPAVAPSQTVLGLSLVRAATGREVLEIRGASIASSATQFSGVATVPRVPCPGSYRYELQSENQETGALSSYSALFTLAPMGSDQVPLCGDLLPSPPGTLRISISGLEETIDFRRGWRNGSGSFFGTFAIGAQPVCDQTYTVSLSADLRGWDRDVRYRLEVADWKAEAQGRELESHDCD